MHRFSVFLRIAGLSFLLFLTALAPARAEEYTCEVMTLEGSAIYTSAGVLKNLKQGDLLKAGDVIEVRDGHVDLAYDKNWNNVTRVWEKSRVKIHSIYPTGLGLDEGGIFAKLHKLPKGSTFEIQTPTAIAAVRGSEYLTEYREGVTRVFNYSPSPVEVFSLDSMGNLLERAVIRESEKTEVLKAAEPPRPPEKMSGEEMRRAGEHRAEIDRSVELVFEAGRIGQTQDIEEVEAMRAKEEEGRRRGHPESGDGQHKHEGTGPGGPGSGPGEGQGNGNLTESQQNELKEIFRSRGLDEEQIEKMRLDSMRMDTEAFERMKENMQQMTPEEIGRMKESVKETGVRMREEGDATRMDRAGQETKEMPVKTVDPDRVSQIEERAGHAQKNVERAVDKTAEKVMDQMDRQMTETEKKMYEDWCKTHNC
ncbi:MAG: hypothetical protein HYT89_01815 [Candidatus Omnitrophica bacterium]|nr:hypothetical protein [Candidatus Omnitrophota bacterium]